MSELTELLSRVEEASGPDRELDLALQAAMSSNPWRWHRRDDETITWEQYGPNALGNPICSLERYTESIDDAVALCEGVLPGWAHAHISEKLRGCIAYVHNNEMAFVGIGARENTRREWYECRAKTPALALCAAVLKAKIAAMSEPTPSPEISHERG